MGGEKKTNLNSSSSFAHTCTHPLELKSTKPEN